MLREKAITRHAPYYFVEDLISKSFYKFNEKTKRMTVHMESSIFNRPIETELQMLGQMQAQNAAMAALCVKKILPNLSEEIIEKGLFNAKLPGRFEILENVKNYEGINHLILDGAHTYNSIRLTIDTLNKLFGDSKVNLLFACAADKDVKDIAKLFKYRFEHIYVTKPGNKKKSDLDAEQQAFSEAQLSFTADSDYKKMIEKALFDSSENNVNLLVTGSFYLLAEVNDFLSKNSR